MFAKQGQFKLVERFLLDSTEFELGPEGNLPLLLVPLIKAFVL